MLCLLLVQTFRLLSIISQVPKQNGMGFLQLIAKERNVCVLPQWNLAWIPTLHIKKYFYM